MNFLRTGTIAACLALGACQPDDGRTATELRGLREELRAMAAAAPRVLPADVDLRSAMAPLQQALQNVLSRHQDERGRWSDLSREVTQLTNLVADRSDGARKQQLTAMQERLANLERDLQAQKATYAEEQKLILGAMELTVEKLDVFLRRVRELEPAGGSKPAGPPADPAASQTGTPPAAPIKGEPNAAKPPAAGKPKTDASEPQRSGVDLTLGVIGAALVLLLVTIIILFPGPMNRGQRPPIVELSAREDDDEDRDLTPELLEAMEAIVLEPDMPPGQHLEPDDATDDEAAPFVEAEDDTSMPWRVEQEMPCLRPEVVGPLVHERLTQDPRVLVEPAPCVRSGSETLTLRYHLAPHLTRTEAERLRGEVEDLAFASPDKEESNGTPAA